MVFIEIVWLIMTRLNSDVTIDGSYNHYSSLHKLNFYSHFIWNKQVFTCQQVILRYKFYLRNDAVKSIKNLHLQNDKSQN